MDIVNALRDGTARALWEAAHVIDCIPTELWEEPFGGAPVWKHAYHTLHSLDRWPINPDRYEESDFHTPGLSDLDTEVSETLSREQMDAYFRQVKEQSERYLRELTAGQLTEKPEGCRWDRFTLILAQHRYLHTHMRMLMGFVLIETGRWPRILGLEKDFPQGNYDKFYGNVL